jgi:glycosyltransferase involved in cell wall biosynthesis
MLALRQLHRSGVEPIPKPGWGRSPDRAPAQLTESGAVSGLRHSDNLGIGSSPSPHCETTIIVRIAIASVYLGQVQRGVESWASDLAAELHRRGKPVTLFKGGGRAELPYEVRVPCVDHTGEFARRVARLTRHGGWRFGCGSPAQMQQNTFALNLARYLRRDRYALVHTQDARAAVMLERLRRWRLHPAKVILGHGTEESLDYLLRFPHVQELSPYALARDYEQGLPADRQWFAIPNFVDCEMFCPGDRRAARRQFAIPAERFVVLDVAALKITHKRLDALAHEVARLRESHPAALLIVAGAATPETPQVEAAVRRELGDSVRVLSNVKRTDLVRLYRAADVFAHMAVAEMMPIALLEALACGLPVVANRFPVLEWIVGPGGMTVDVTQPGQLAAALRPLADTPARLQELGRQARIHALENFATPRVTDQILAMYDSVLASPS